MLHLFSIKTNRLTGRPTSSLYTSRAAQGSLYSLTTSKFKYVETMYPSGIKWIKIIASQDLSDSGASGDCNKDGDDWN